jgi:hypothetical protein
MRILSKLAALAVVAGTIPAASAQPPQQGRGHSQAAAHTSAVQQALANRQQILSQIAGHGADTGAASRAQGLDRATAGSANASASGRAQGLFRASAGAGNAAAANARGLERASIATGTGRLGNDVLRGLRSDAAARATGLGRADFVRGQLETRFEQVRSDRQNPGNATKVDATSGRRNELVSGGLNRRAMTQADRLLAKRLADIDHLRDQALRNGNTRLLEQADRLEALARRQYDRRINDTKLNAAEIFRDRTTPNP